MAIYYVWSGAAGSANGSSWANAFTTLSTAFSTESAGDTLYVAHDHAESTAAAITLTSSGTVSNPTRVICVDRAGTVPPVSADRRATGSVATTANNNITLGGFTHYDGIIFSAGTSSTATIFAPSVSQWMRFDNCSLRIGAPGGSISIGASAASGSLVELNNTTMSFANSTSTVSITGVLKWRNTPSALIGAAVPVFLFTPTPARGGSVECIGVDLSAAGSSTTLVAAAATTFANTYRFADCKLNASVVKSAVPASHGSTEIDFVRSGSSGVNYTVFRHRISGTLDQETTIVRTGGASDGTTTISWKVITTANCMYSMPFECPPIAIWNDTTGSAVTATVEGIWGGGAVPNDDDVWLDVEYLGSASSPQASFAGDGKANLLAAAAAQTSSSATWGGGTTYATFDGSPTNATLSNGNKTATHSNTMDGGARSVAFKGNSTPGKYYFEVTLGATHGFADSVGVITAAATYANVITGNGGIMALSGNSGIIFNNGISTGKTLGAWVSGDIIGVAFDVTAGGASIWFRRNAGNWNGDPTANPATGVGAVTTGVGSNVAPTITFGSTGSLANDNMTINAGQSAFTGAVPSGFTSGWPALSLTAFKLNVTFTPQQKGLIYARVKCAKVSSTFYIDPLITLS